MNSQAKVLLVEDYEANILVATTLLETFGYDYEVASTGKEALEKLEKGDFMVALMDIQMPDMSGTDITKEWRKKERDKKLGPTSIIAMTAFALSGDREKFLESGMDDYISKPFDPENLEKKLQHHVDICLKKRQAA